MKLDAGRRSRASGARRPRTWRFPIVCRQHSSRAGAFDRMRIAYVTSMLPFGSQEAYFIPELRELRAAGHDVLVVPMRPRGGAVQREAIEVSTVRRQPLLSVEIVHEAV